MFYQMGIFIILVLLAVGILTRFYFKQTTKWCKSHVCLTGKTVIITGANQGIGYETALNLAKRGAKVILACRSEEKAQEARATIIKETGNLNVLVRIIDLASFDSVKKFANNIIATEERVDILINNAGLLEGGSTKKTVDGHLQIMQVNHFSSFLLTSLLLDLIKKSTGGRIINVSSNMAMLAFSLTPTKLDAQSASWNHYFYTKLCNILFTQELARRLEGTGVSTFSLHPGIVDTQIFKEIPRPLRTLVNYLKMNILQTREEGAQTTIYCAVEKGIEKYSGEHFSSCRKVAPYWTATDPKLAREIWEKTEKIFVT